MANEKLAYSVIEAANAAGVGRTTIYAEISASRLIARKIRRRTVILRGDLDSWLKAHPASSKQVNPEIANEATDRNCD